MAFEAHIFRQDPSGELCIDPVTPAKWGEVVGYYDKEGRSLLLVPGADGFAELYAMGYGPDEGADDQPFDPLNVTITEPVQIGAVGQGGELAQPVFDGDGQPAVLMVKDLGGLCVGQSVGARQGHVPAPAEVLMGFSRN